MSKERLFGTDGVRGVANRELTASLAMQLGMATGHWVRQHETTARPKVIVGRDTRLSGDMLEAALAAGLAAMGMDVLQVGVVPTPAVSQMTLSRGASKGVVISASHNPFEDNGIKFFGSNGKKLPDAIENEIEALLPHCEQLLRPVGGDIGRILQTREPVADYVERVLATMTAREATPLAGMRLVMDCANGAAYELGPQIFRRLGAEVITIHAQPDGVNINVKCGSTRPQEMAAKTKELGAHAGLAFDGDADRVILADEQGNLVDGDRIMAIIALDLKTKGLLHGNTVVATIMSNVGLEQALQQAQIRLHRTNVGDRYVAEAMERLGAAIGGEQSGHILLPQVTPTGDGLVTALQVLNVLREKGKPLSRLAGVVQNCPQLLKSVRVRTQQGWEADPEIQQAIVAGQNQLGSAEWLSVRPSGTEPLIRVMAQGMDQTTVEAVVYDICALVERKFGIEATG